MSNDHSRLTIIELLNRSSKYLKEKHIENPRLNAEQLLARVLGLDRVQLYLQYDRQLIPQETTCYREYIRRRTTNEPLQYILGETEFMGYLFKVAPGVLIPRPETELLVEKVLQLRETIQTPHPCLWDIGTGSGCIAISLALNWKECTVIGTDISDEALIQAQNNARMHKVDESIRFIKHDVLNELQPLSVQADIILSNPPYISKKEFEALNEEIRMYEPPEALTDGGDGLLFYKKIFSLIKNGLRTKFCLLELSGLQTEAILSQARQISVKKMEVFEDLNHIPRVLQLELR
jgi:release factor glutamine methyltransferase